MSHLSATELSRLHRQRRLEISTHRSATLLNLKTRRRRSINSCEGLSSEDAVNQGISNAGASLNFDDQSTAADSTTTDRGKNAPINSSVVNNNIAIRHTRSSSFSSFTGPSSTAKQCISSQPMSTTTALAVIVSPPESPNSRMSKGHRSSAGGRLVSPALSLVSFVDASSYRCNSGSPDRPRVGRTSSSRSLPQTIVSSPGLLMNDSDMPLDELMGTSSCNRRTISPLPPQQHALQSLETSIVRLSPMASSNLTLDHSHHNESPLITMARAIQQQQSLPSPMNADEVQLSESIQSLVVKAKSNASYWEQKYELREAEWATQQKEHDRALLAIQRVLADVTTERELTVTQLKVELERSQEQRDETILKLTQKLRDMQKEIKTQKEADDDTDENSDEYVRRLVQELKQQVEYLQSRNDALELEKEAREGQRAETNAFLSTLSNSEQPVQDLIDDIESKAQQIEKLELKLESAQLQRVSSTDNDVTEDQTGLHKQLNEKTVSLENAKMIIASLESANGSLARELRAKLKEKEEELAKLTSTSDDRERTLDSLVVELRGLKRQQQNPRLTRKQLANQRELCQMLERRVNSLRQAAVQFDGRNDQSSVDNIAQIVSETFTSLKQNLESWNTYLKNAEAEVADDEPAKTVNTSSEQNLERALAKKDDETKKLRKEIERLKAEHHQESTNMHQEISSLKERLANNMEILAKKGRELSVLRESLNVEDSSVGYISDDGTDGYETETDRSEQLQHGPLPGSSGSHTNDMPSPNEVDGVTTAEIQFLRNEIIKQQKDRDAKAIQLRSEKESLANAKMIISSLEKANKSMLEDLRSRLQDSNTAIASLLDKSMEHEKTISMLRQELKTARQEKEEEEQKLKSQMAKLRDANLVFSVRLAAKEREIEELQSQIEGHEVPISIARLSSVEEKKDDPASEEEN
jgi:chromosome segregation ATPase